MTDVRRLRSHLAGQWREGEGTGHTLVNPATEEVLGEVRSEGLDLAGALEFARARGGPALRAL